jgi:hypothetical protein
MPRIFGFYRQGKCLFLKKITEPWQKYLVLTLEGYLFCIFKTKYVPYRT